MPALDDDTKRVVRWLRRAYPLPKPVRVMVTKGLPVDCNGYFLGDDRWWRIFLRPGLSKIEMREVLLHEWAHGLTCLQQNEAKSQMDHDSIFTLAYNRLLEDYEQAFPELPLRMHRA